MQAEEDPDATTAVRRPESPYATAHAVQTRGIHAELAQLGSLLGDAVTRLTASFEAVSTLLPRRCACNAHEDATAADQRRATLERHLGDVIAALQFHDIATQILGHASMRVQRLEQMREGIECLPDRSSAGPDPEWTRDSVDRLSNRVTQSSMATGTTELF